MNNHRFEKRLQLDASTSQEVIRLLAKIDECKGYWEAFASLSPQYLQDMKRAVIISSSGSSTRIEGAHLSDKDVELLLRSAKVRTLATRDEQEVLGYLETIQDVFSAWDTMQFSESTIKQIHARTLEYSEKDMRHKGEYKFAPNRVEAINADGKIVGVVFDPTPPFLTPKEMQELTEWTQGQLQKNTIHPLLILANFIYEFLAIHPFQDGNGRVSRIVTNLLLLQNGYSFAPYVSHEKIIEDHKVDYYLALKKTSTTWKTDQENIAPWILFILRMFARQAEMAVALTQEDQTENLLSENQLAVWRALQQVETLSRKEIAEQTGANIRTVDQVLVKLLKLKKIMKIGRGRATKYRAL
jgi:Fic family protein